MLGIQELSFIALIVVVFVFVRPLFSKKQPAPRTARPAIKLSGKWRLAVAASIVYPAAVAAYIRPWRSDSIVFYYIGIGPVVLGWLVGWIAVGFKKRP